jgi:hypothetical protein
VDLLGVPEFVVEHERDQLHRRPAVLAKIRWFSSE